LGLRDKKRPVEDNERRNAIITADVAKKVEAGLSEIKASKEVAKELAKEVARGERKLSHERIRQIYRKYRGSDLALLGTTIGDIVNTGN
jgi:hypothetical protein